MALMSKDTAHALAVLVLILFSSSNVSQTTSLDDVECLKSIKHSLEDPFDYLTTSWNFNNDTQGFICKFPGVECWQPDENKVLNIRLLDMGLKGRFPAGIKYCTSLVGLDLSSNKLSGSIPSDISNILKFVTSLDLSNNNFSGEIPSSFANCSYLNILKLNNNRFTGKIPQQLGTMERIKAFSVANNLLKGPVPSFANSSISAEAYANNLGLCGYPLNPCPKKSRVGIFAAAAAAGVAFSALLIAGVFLCKQGVVKKKKEVMGL